MSIFEQLAQDKDTIRDIHDDNDVRQLIVEMGIASPFPPLDEVEPNTVHFYAYPDHPTHYIALVRFSKFPSFVRTFAAVCVPKSTHTEEAFFKFFFAMMRKYGEPTLHSDHRDDDGTLN